MKTLTLKLPDTVEIDAKEALLLLASKLYEQGKISLGQGAQLVGLDKRRFMDKLDKCGVSIFGETLEDIEKDLCNA